MALSISRAWDESSTILRRDGKAIWTVALALIAMPLALLTLIAPQSTAAMGDPAAAGQTSLLQLLASVFLMLATLAITGIALRPQSTVGGAIGEGARRLPSVLGASILIFIPLFIVLMIVAAMVIGVDADTAAIQASIDAGQLPPSFLTFALICAVIGLLIGVKMMLIAPVAVAETGNPVKIIARSWQLSNGHFLKLVGFTLLFVIVAMIVLSAVIFIFGGMAIALFGVPEPMTVGALFTGLVIGLAYAVIVPVYVVMIARIYGQLAHADVGVPNVERA